MLRPHEAHQRICSCVLVCVCVFVSVRERFTWKRVGQGGSRQPPCPCIDESIGAYARAHTYASVHQRAYARETKPSFQRQTRVHCVGSADTPALGLRCAARLHFVPRSS
jgi:hypothetical protein